MQHLKASQCSKPRGLGSLTQPLSLTRWGQGPLRLSRLYNVYSQRLCTILGPHIRLAERTALSALLKSTTYAFTAHTARDPAHLPQTKSL